MGRAEANGSEKIPRAEILKFAAMWAAGAQSDSKKAIATSTKIYAHRQQSV